MSIRYEQEAERHIFRLFLQSIIREGLVSFHRTPGGVHVEVPKGGVLEIPVTRTYISGHMDMEEDPIYISASGSHQSIDRMEQVLTLLGFRQEQFLKELMNSALNYASSLEAFHTRKAALPEPRTGEDTWAYISRRRREEKDLSPLVFFEQWVIGGHTTHPGARTKLPMTAEDVKRYSPEWGATPELVPLAVQKEYVTETAPFHTDMTKVLVTSYPELEEEWEQLDGDYKLIPLHPWQAEHVLPEYYSRELEEGIFLPLQATIPTAALMSFRTMAPLTFGAPHIKTAVHVQMTSAVRTVSAASTRNGPIMAGLLGEIREKEEDISETMAISRDLAGLHYTPLEKEEAAFYEKNIAALLRENPEAGLAEDEMAMPAAALLTESPVTGRILLEELAGGEGGILTFLEAYSRILFPGLVRLMSDYGIAMEAHLQNTVVVFRDRKPVRIEVRDCGGVRILSERLDAHFEQPPIDPSTNLLASKEEELTDIFSHALFHNHLGEIIVTLARTTDISDRKMWETIRIVLENIFDDLGTEASLRDKERIFAETSRMKSLVRMRLSDHFTEYAFVDIPNPLRKEAALHDDPSNHVSSN